MNYHYQLKTKRKQRTISSPKTIKLILILNISHQFNTFLALLFFFFFWGGWGLWRTHKKKKKNPAFAWSRMEPIEQIAHVTYPCPFQPYLTSCMFTPSLQMEIC